MSMDEYSMLAVLDTQIGDSEYSIRQMKNRRLEYWKMHRIKGLPFAENEYERLTKYLMKIGEI